MKFAVVLFVVLCSLFIVNAEDDIILYRGQSQEVNNVTTTLVDVFADNSILLRVGVYEQRLSTKGRWVAFGPFEVQLTAVYNRLEYSQDQAAFIVKGFSFPVEEIVVVAPVDPTVTLLRGQSYSYGGHVFTLVRTTEAYAILRAEDGTEVQVRESHSGDYGDVVIRLTFMTTNILDPSLDRADFLFSGADSPGEVVEEVPVVPEVEPLVPVDDGFADSQIITVEPTPEDVVFDEVPAEPVAEPVAEEVPAERGFFSRLFRSLLSVFGL